MNVLNENREAIEQYHACPQLREWYYPTASDNAEDRRRKKENKRKFKKKKQETLGRNSQALASL